MTKLPSTFPQGLSQKLKQHTVRSSTPKGQQDKPTILPCPTRTTLRVLHFQATGSSQNQITVTEKPSSRAAAPDECKADSCNPFLLIPRLDFITGMHWDQPLCDEHQAPAPVLPSSHTPLPRGSSPASPVPWLPAAQHRAATRRGSSCCWHKPQGS